MSPSTPSACAEALTLKMTQCGDVVLRRSSSLNEAMKVGLSSSRTGDLIGGGEGWGGGERGDERQIWRENETEDKQDLHVRSQ